WKASIGTITGTGLYTASGGAGSVTVTATSIVDPTKSAVATVNVTLPMTSAGVSSVTISPVSTPSVTSGTLPFTATVQGTASNKSVSWKATLGSITSTGFYTAPE